MSATPSLRLYREDCGCTCRAGRGYVCWRVCLGGTWWDLCDFDPQLGRRPVVAVSRGQSMDAAALGEPAEWGDLPPRVAAKLRELGGAP